MSIESIIWSNVDNYKIKGTYFTLMGYSIAGRNTGFYIPELKIALDCGVPHDFMPTHIFITHVHLDHCGSLPATLFSADKSKPKIYLPGPSEQNLRNYIHYTFAMTKHTMEPKIHSSYKLYGLPYNKSIEIEIKRMKWKVDVIKCSHTVPCSGYGFSEMRSKLKPEYIGYSQEDLEGLKTSGIEICQLIELPHFCFLGDTDYKIFENDIIFKFNTIIIECTFIHDEHIKLAMDDKHMHWNDLKPHIIAHPDINFVLIHFSARYSCEEIERFFFRENIPNVKIWI
jgi:ribonuclease Z